MIKYGVLYPKKVEIGKRSNKVLLGRCTRWCPVMQRLHASAQVQSINELHVVADDMDGGRLPPPPPLHMCTHTHTLSLSHTHTHTHTHTHARTRTFPKHFCMYAHTPITHITVRTNGNIISLEQHMRTCGKTQSDVTKWHVCSPLIRC